MYGSSIFDRGAGCAGRFVPERTFAAIKKVSNWTTVVRRIGLEYDLFGDVETD